MDKLYVNYGSSEDIDKIMCYLAGNVIQNKTVILLD